MTVWELIQTLQRLPQDAPVVGFSMNDSGQDWHEEIVQPLLTKMRRVERDDNRPEEFNGSYLEPNAHGYQPTKLSEPVDVVVL